MEDLVEGALLALEKSVGFQIYNIASGSNVTINEVLKVLLELDGYQNARVVYNMDKPTMIPYKILSIEKAKRELGFRPRTTIHEGLEKTLQWYKKNRLE